MERMMVVLATKNRGKVREFEEILKGSAIEVKCLADFGPIPPVEEDGATFDENAYKKAAFTAKVLGLPAIADDSGLVVEALGGRPGVHSARYAGPDASDAMNIDKLLHEMRGVANREAAFECVISVAAPNGPALTYEGRCEGTITEVPRGGEGFGYDPVFFCPGLGKTFAESTLEEKNRVSHRGKALAELRSEGAKVLAWLRQRMAEIKPPKPDHEPYLHNDWSRDRMR